MIVAPSFPDLDEAARIVREGSDRLPDAIWVVRDRDKQALEVMHRAGVLEPVKAPSLPRKWGSGETRLTEMMVLCTKVVIFHEPGAQTTKNILKRRYVDARETIPRWQHEGKDKINVVERGKPKRRARKGRKPVGA